MDSRYRDAPNERLLDCLQTSKLFSSDSAAQEHLKEIGFQVLEPTQGGSNRELDDEEVNLAIVSVVEAIDRLQALAHVRAESEQPFAGGFAITTCTSLQLAMTGNIDDDGTTLLSRPRRAWLVPVVISSEGILLELQRQAKEKKVKWSPPKGHRDEGLGHTFLALVQDISNEEGGENPGGTHFEMSFFDSDTEIFNGVTDIIATLIRRAARHLGWSTHREVFKFASLKVTMKIPPVPQQPKGGWQCGYHTIVNAWIIVMGLHPAQKATYTHKMYEEICGLARAATIGILDWRTLAEWLIVRNLTEEITIDEVPTARRFYSTFCQTTENALRQRIDGDYGPIDAIVGVTPPSELPYDRSNNYYESIQGPGEDLARGYEDMDLDFPDHRKASKRKLPADRSDGIDSLDDAAAKQGIRHAGAANLSRRHKRRKLSNSLSFLDSY